MLSCKSHYRNFPPPFPIPDSWVWVKLDEITFCIVDCPHTTAKNEGQGFALIRTPNVGEGELMLNGVHRVSENIYNLRNARAVPTNGDIIYAREAPAGNAAVVRQEKVCLGQRTVLIKPLKEFCNSEYLAYALLAPLSKNRLISKATGSTVQHVNLENIRPFKIPFPPLEEQERIVVKLKGFFKLLTNVSTGADILSSLIKNCKSKILDLAMQGKLVPQNPADEPAADMLLRINPKAKIITDNPHSWNIPENCCVTNLKSIGKWQSGATPSKMNSDYYGVGYPWLNTGDLTDDYIYSIPKQITELALKETSVKLNQSGSVLIAMYGATIGKLGILTFPATTNQACCACATCHINNRFLFYFLKYYRPEFINMGGGGAQPNISKEKIENTVLMLPPVNEQKRIVDKIEELYSMLEEIEASLQS